MSITTSSVSTVGVCQLVIFVLVLYMSDEARARGEPLSEEVICNQQLFSFRCPADHVIYIQNAKYTRREGACVGKVLSACDCDVTNSLSKSCSGRDFCSIRVLKRNFQECKLCSKDFNQHLYVNKTCIPVARAGHCEPGQPERVDMDPKEGYISSLTTNNTGYGNSSCPWVLPAGEWQRVEISVADFSKDITSHKYFRIKTSDGSEAIHVPAASYGAKMRYIGKFNGPNVKISIFIDNAGSPYGNYLIRYKVHGCPTPYGITARSAKIVKKNSTFLMMDCQYGGLVNMTCNDTQWFPPGLCTGSFKGPGAASAGADVGAIVGGLVGALIIGVCIFVFIGKYRSDKHDPDDSSEAKDEKAKQPLKEPPSISKPMLIEENEEPPPKNWNWKDPDRVKPDLAKRRETAPAEMLLYAAPNKPLKNNIPDIVEEVEECEQKSVKNNRKKPPPPPKPKGKFQIKR